MQGKNPAFFFRGQALGTSINPNPFFIRRGFDLIPKPLCPLQGRGLTDYEGNPLHQGFGMALGPLPLRGSPFFSTSLLSPPLGKGLTLAQIRTLPPQRAHIEADKSTTALEWAHIEAESSGA